MLTAKAVNFGSLLTLLQALSYISGRESPVEIASS